jgi:hypothetical protein
MFEDVRPQYPGNIVSPGTRLVWSFKAALSVVRPENQDLHQQANVVLHTMTGLHRTVHSSLFKSRDRLQKCIDELLLCHETQMEHKLCAYDNKHNWTAQTICVNGVTLKTRSMEVEICLENELHALLFDKVFLEELDNAIAVGRGAHLTSLVSLYHQSILVIPLRHFGLHEVHSVISRFLRFYNFANDNELHVFFNNLLERVQGLCSMISNPMQDPRNMAVTWFIYKIDFVRRHVELHPMETDQLL